MADAQDVDFGPEGRRRPEFAAFGAMLSEAGMPRRLIDEFYQRYQRYRAGDHGRIPWHEVTPPAPEDIADHSELPTLDEERSRAICGQLCCIKLNGGLGTTMKLATTKSLIPVRDGRSFLRIIADHVLSLRRQHGVRTPLLLMNSYRTHEPTLRALADFAQPGLPVSFLQHKVPRIDAATGLPVDFDDEPERWTPAGHGNVYLAMHERGLLDALLDRGVRWAFVANVDNLGATVDPRIPVYLEEAGLDFAMEVTPKTAADIKGGTLVRWRERLMLVERTQVPEPHLPDFEDIERLPYFNTNSIWWRVEALRDAVAAGRLDLPMIVNPKTVFGVPVVQLEIAMGAAIGSFERARGIVVSRQRFAPVKTTNDLLGVRSDAYVLDDIGGLRPSAERDPALGPPVIRLDPRYYQGIADFDARFPDAPSLVGCRSLTVHGDVRFGSSVVLRGDVEIRAAGAKQVVVADGREIEDESRTVR